MKRTKKYNLKDFFTNIISAFKKLISDDNEPIYVELTGELAKDPIENLLQQDPSSNEAPNKSRKKASASKVGKSKAAQGKTSNTPKVPTKTRKPKSQVAHEPEEPSL